MNDSTKALSTQHYKCTGCGADLTYAPGTTVLSCRYCGTEQQICSINDKLVVEETDYRKFLSVNVTNEHEKQEVHTIKCTACGAMVTLTPNTTSDLCVFCGTSLIARNTFTNNTIKPRYLLPFKITQSEALVGFRVWIKKLWFAPNKLKKYGDRSDKLNGVYIPYWTYDSSTSTEYTGQRGIDHTESYTVTVNGKQERRTRIVTHWSNVSGNVRNTFDDILVLASNSLPRNYAEKLDPWDLSNLTEFDEQFLSGFRTESYQIDLENGFDKAKAIIQGNINSAICNDIGGNHQRITSSSTTYENITFKHILLPIWISAYRYKEKVYRFMINGRTGEVQGERPWSWIKITLAVLGFSTFIAIIYSVYMCLN
jgi:predicted RNA-binding Zn-ribbon protein involved in translation (DUF1610 family)